MRQLSNVIGVDMIKKEVGGRHTKGNIRSERLGPEKPSRSYKIIILDKYCPLASSSTQCDTLVLSRPMEKT